MDTEPQAPTGPGRGSWGVRRPRRTRRLRGKWGRHWPHGLTDVDASGGSQPRPGPVGLAGPEPPAGPGEGGHELRAGMGFLALRGVLAVVQLLLVMVAAFGLTALLPGDAAVVVLGEQANSEQAELVRQRLGLDQPFGARLADWGSGVLTGDLGHSLVTGTPVADEIAARFGVTALLAGVSVAVLLPLALMVGVACGLREGSLGDRALNLVTIVLHAVPEFVLGLVLLAVFAAYAGVLPATAAGLSGPGLLQRPLVLVLPVAVLVTRQLGDLARQLRIGVAEHAAGEVAGHLRLLGLPERTILVRHVLAAAAGPVIQQLARALESLLCGAVVVESLFAIDGLGAGFVEAVENRDVPAVQGYVLIFAALVVLTNLVADLAAWRWMPYRDGAR